MLAADKDRLVAALKQNALGLRQKELEYYVERYSNITTQASILAGFAFDSLVELEISEDMREAMGPSGRWKADLRWMETVYYGAASLTMALALYTVCVSSFATVYGHRLALQGPTGSVERAVAVMMKQRQTIFVTYGLALFSLVIAAITMAWIKMGAAAAFVTAVFGLFFIALIRKHQQMKMLFLIPQESMVQGDVRLFSGVNEVDAPLHPIPPHSHICSFTPPVSRVLFSVVVCVCVCDLLIFLHLPRHQRWKSCCISYPFTDMPIHTSLSIHRWTSPVSRPATVSPPRRLLRPRRIRAPPLLTTGHLRAHAAQWSCHPSLQ